MEKILIIERNILNPECCSFLKQKGYDVTKIDFSDAPTFNQRSFVNKYLNIFLRVVFQYKNYFYKEQKDFIKGIRIAGLYTSMHGGWYKDMNNLTEEEEFYQKTANSSSSWNFDNSGKMNKIYTQSYK